MVYKGLKHSKEMCTFLLSNPNRGVARICERGFPARIAHAHNLRLRAVSVKV